MIQQMDSQLKTNLFKPNFFFRCSSDKFNLGYADILIKKEDRTQCNVITLYSFQYPSMADIVTTVFSFGNPILKYSQRFSTFCDLDTGLNYISTNNDPLDHFLNDFSTDLKSISDIKNRKLVIENLNISQSVNILRENSTNFCMEINISLDPL
jgi:hypothetical protein